MKIGELSNISGVSVQTIRYYEAEGLICPIEVDRWTNYRYYDESSVVRLAEISQLKKLGFTLNEIKNFSDEVIKSKIDETKLNIKQLTQNVQDLSNMYQRKGDMGMKIFVNDERVVGRWKKLAVVKNKEDFAKKIFSDYRIFNFEELYFLPKGERYWVFSWIKGILFLKDRELPYEIIDEKLYVGVVDPKTNNIDNYAVYEKVDNNIYSKDKIAITDDTNVPFINDTNVVGFWKTVDFVRNFNQFKPGRKFWKDQLLLNRYVFEPNGNLIVIYSRNKNPFRMEWSKGCVINKNDSTVSEYVIKTINGNSYMFVEWKSGDYLFGGKVKGYYVLKKEN